MTRNYYIYIMASVSNDFLYIGITNDLHRRISEHKIHLNKGFTHQHNISKLVYYEMYYYVNEAIAREKQLKKWKRAWKNDLINKINPNWFDISDDPNIPPTTEFSYP